ncbi:MAG: NAD(P)-binding domain-containing protein [Actinobacteria bacterium]|jgi:cation diffusion facilitator CzcD-associated flavoprotein CzcO|nr:NAD(P)-binding domain-containing protein [Actinomycetota bacterium]
MRSPRVHDVVVVGAGPAGIGVAAALGRAGVRAVLVDRYEVGASFRRWPEGMRLITPSFTSNQFHQVDLNAITPETSPALSLTEEHPTGQQYADYLGLVVELEDLHVRTGVDVLDVEPYDDGTLGVLSADGRDLYARHVVWAAGEAQYPRTNGFRGAERCVPTVQVPAWVDHPGEAAVVIGGYESGIDAAVHLVEAGQRVTVVDPGEPWNVVDADPSRTLSPYTRGRLRRAYATGRLELVGDARVVEVAPEACGFAVATDAGESFHSDGPPLLATGFVGSLAVVRDRFAFDEHGRVEVTESADESTVVDNLFLAGPALAHRGAIFCFIYKFRQRFGVVAREITDRLGYDAAPLEDLRDHGFLLDDLSCCADCAC